MSGLYFTEKQLEAIEYSDKSILVSAAAGSGKTAVLTERVCRLLCDEEKKISPEELLIVTFTRSAAREMCERISQKMMKRSRQNPNNKWVKRQIMLLPLATISTIDSFCQRIVKEYFFFADCEPDFKFADNAEILLMSDLALDMAQAEMLETYGDDFAALNNTLFEGYDDIGLRKVVSRLYDYIYSLPFPEDFLEKSVQNYKSSEDGQNFFIRQYRAIFGESEEAESKISFFNQNREKMAYRMELLSILMKKYMNHFDTIKKEKNTYSFADIEHKALSLICQRNEGVETVTPLGSELANRFSHVLVDEYQDTNELQDKIFRIISNNGKNLFMVGDAKQSIYRFRQANPQIFLSLRKGEEKSTFAKPHNINLLANFRSSGNVCNTINSIFSRIMTGECGDINYDENEALLAGTDYGTGDTATEYFLIDKKNSKQNLDCIEPHYIANWIEEKIGSGYEIYDAKSGHNRPLKYGDIAILLRSTKVHGNIFKKSLQKRGIPVSFKGDENPFSSLEVRIITDLLKAINNPSLDVPLLSVLMSPIFNLSADMVTEMRLLGKKNLYEALLLAADQNLSFALDALTLLSSIKQKSKSLPLPLFLEDLYVSTGYFAVVTGMNNGESKKQNLQRLIFAAENYSDNSNGSIYGFIKYLEELQNNEKPALAPAVSNDENAVKIMTIHGSKGLEFPICIVAGLSRKKMVESNPAVFNQSMGIGLYLYDEELDALYKNISLDVIRAENEREDASEELRILYVALTRAKNKLILISTEDDLDKTLKNHGEYVRSLLSDGKDKLDPDYVLEHKKYSDRILPALMLSPYGQKLRDWANVKNYKGENSPDIVFKRFTFSDSDLETPDLETVSETYLPDLEMACKLRENLSFSYPNADGAVMQSKITASQWSRKQSDGDHQFRLFEKSTIGAEKGTAVHHFMQYANFKNAEADAKKEAERLKNLGFITNEEFVLIDFDKLNRFFSSDLYKRINDSPLVMKEKQFTILTDATNLSLSKEKGNKLVLQGVCDLAFVENGKLIVIDYKTDYVKNLSELMERYKEQLLFYARCLEEITEYEVSDIGIYSFHLNKACEEPYNKD